MTAKAFPRRLGAIAIAAAVLSVASFGSPNAPVISTFAAASAQAQPMEAGAGMGGRGMMREGMRGRGMMRHGMRGHRGFGGGAGMFSAGMAAAALFGAMSHAHAEEHSTGAREDCFRFCGVHVHTSNLPGKPAVQVIGKPKLKRDNCKNGRCKPIPYGQYNLWPYTDAQGNKYAQITDRNGNPVNTGAPGAQINGYTIIR